jgi:hypothetical protein
MPCAAVHPNGTLFAICGNGHSITNVLGDPSAPPWEAHWAPQRHLAAPQNHHNGTHQEQGNWEDPGEVIAMHLLRPCPTLTDMIRFLRRQICGGTSAATGIFCTMSILTAAQATFHSFAILGTVSSP